MEKDKRKEMKLTDALSKRNRLIKALTHNDDELLEVLDEVFALTKFIDYENYKVERKTDERGNMS